MSLSLLDWRRRVAAIYAEVRRVAEADPESAWTQWRAARDNLFATHPDSPRRDAAPLPFAPYDASLRFVVSVETDVAPQRIEVETTDAQPVVLDRAGRVTLPVGQLDVWWVGSYGGGLFLPFADATNGTSSYGGGRYLLDTAKGADLGGSDDQLVVDFNFAFNPSCAYSPRWVCPLAPPGNKLRGAVNAGELAPR